MALYISLEPFSYTVGDKVYHVTEPGRIVELTTEQAANYEGRVAYWGSGSNYLAPQITMLAFDNYTLFPHLGSQFHVYLDQSTKELWQWTDAEGYTQVSIGAGGGASARLKLYHDFRKDPDGVPTVADSGQEWSNVKTTGELPTVIDGELDEPGYHGATSLATYTTTELDDPVTYLQADFRFDSSFGSTEDSSFCMAASTRLVDPTGNVVFSIPIHVVATSTYLEWGSIIDLEFESLAVFTYADFTDDHATDDNILDWGNVHIEAAWDPSTGNGWVKLPNGTVQAVSSDNLKVSTTWAFYESYYLHANTDHRVKILQVGADDSPITGGTKNYLTRSEALQLFVPSESAGGVTLDGAQTLNDKTLHYAKADVLFSPGGDATLALGDAAGTTANFILLYGAVTGAGPLIVPDGAETNIDLRLGGKGTGKVQIVGILDRPSMQGINDAAGKRAIEVANGSLSAVNYLQTVNAPTGSGPALVAAGSDANVPLILAGKGTGRVILNGTISPNVDLIRDVNGAGMLLISGNAGAVNCFVMYNSPTGGPPVLGVAGADNNADLVLAAKGTGVVAAGGSGTAFQVLTPSMLHALANKSTPATADELTVLDSAASFLPKRVTIAQLTTMLMAALGAGAPATLDTIDEIAAALGDDPNAITTIMNSLATKQPEFLTGTVSTASGTAAKTVTLDPPYDTYTPATGDFLLLTFTNGSAVSTPTLAVNGGAVRGMASGNGATSNANTPITAGVTLLMILRADGTWQWIGSTIAALAALTNAEVDAGTATTGRALTGQTASYIRGPLLAARTVNGTETVTVASGSITQVNGLTVGGVTLAVGDKFVVLGAPAATGACTVAATTMPANGLYQVTAVGTNLTVSRAAEMAGTNSPIGKMIRITEGANYGPGVNSVVTVNSPTSGAFTYGTTAMQLGDYFLGWIQTLSRITALLNGKADSIGISSGRMLDKAIVNAHPESSRFSMLSPLFNDQAYNLARGGALTLTRNGTTEVMGAPDKAFTPDVQSLNISAVNGSSDVLVLECTLASPMTYSTVYGIQFSQAFRAQNVQIDLYDSVAAAWINNITTVTNDTEGVVMFKSNGGGNGGANPITKVRYTLTNFNSSSGSTIRIVSIFTVGYASTLLRAGFVDRGGGTIYGDINQATDPSSGNGLARKAYVDAQVATAVPKSSVVNTVYAVDNSGNQVQRQVSSASLSTNTIVFRGSGGVTAVGTPTDPTHASPKAYVDAKTTEVLAAEYGALGDNAFDNTTAITNAIAAVGTKGVVWLPPGIFRHTGITMVAGVEVKGSGVGRTILRNTHATNPSVKMYGTPGGPYLNGAGISDLTIDATAIRSTQVGIDALLAQSHNVNRVEIVNHGIGLQHRASWESLYENVHVHGCTLGYSFPVPGAYTPSAPFTLVACHAVECGVAFNIADGVQSMLWSGGDFSVTTGAATGIIDGNSTGQITFQGCNFEGATNDDIIFGSATGGPANVSFIGCRFFSETTKARSIYFQRGDGLNFIGCRWTGNTKVMRQDSTTGTATFTGCSGLGYTTFVDMNGTLSDAAPYLVSSAANGVGGLGPGSNGKANSLKANAWLASSVVYAAGKVGLTDADFPSVTPVEGAIAGVYNTTDNTFRVAMRHFDSTWVTLPTQADVATKLSLSRVTVSTTATLSVSANTDTVVLLNAGAVPTLPTAVGATQGRITVINTTASAINLATTSAQTISGVAGPYSLAAKASITLVSDNANWWKTA